MTANTLGVSTNRAIFDWLWDSPYRDAVVDLAATDITTDDEGAGDGETNTGNTGDGSANNAATGAPVIDGTPQVDETLTADTDDGSPSQDDIHRVRVTVTNVDEVPVISGPGAVEYEENGEHGVASYTAADPEGGDTVSWGLAGGDAGLFSISDAGELAFSDAPDFEAPLDTDEDNVYSVTIQATDASDIMGTMDVAITVTDADGDGMVGKYDINGDKLIDKDEAIVAVSDYFSGLITKEEVLEVVNHYFAG